MFVFMVRPPVCWFAVGDHAWFVPGLQRAKKARGRVVTEEGRHTAAQCAQVLRLRTSLRCAQAGLNLGYRPRSSLGVFSHVPTWIRSAEEPSFGLIDART